MKILALSSRDHPGVTAVFRNMFQIGLCEHRFIEDFVIGEEEGFDLLILGAWTNHHAAIFEKVKTKKAVLWTSSLAQSELSPKGVEVQMWDYLLALLSKGYYNFLLCGDYKMSTLWAKHHTQKDKIKFFPYPIYFKKSEKLLDKTEKPSIVGLFTVCRPGKNLLNQLYGFQYATLSNESLVLKTNVVQTDLPNVHFTKWMETEEYEKAKSELDVGLNVFIAESFGYGFLELMAKGIPTICSPSIANNFNLPLTLRQYLEVRDTENLVEIGTKILSITNMGTEEFNSLRKVCVSSIEAVAEKNNRELLVLLKELTAN